MSSSVSWCDRRHTVEDGSSHAYTCADDGVGWVAAALVVQLPIHRRRRDEFELHAGP
jgi:hypothetical protein